MTTIAEQSARQTNKPGALGLTGEGAAHRSVFQQEELKRERIGFVARTASLLVIACWFLVLMPLQDALYYYVILSVFFLIGYGHYWTTANLEQPIWLRFGLIATDFALLAFATLADNPLNDWIIPAPLRLENGNFGYFLIMLIGVGLSYSAWRMIASGICAGVAWAGGYWWVASQPGAFTAHSTNLASLDDWIHIHQDPMFVDLNVLYQDLIVLMLITGILALTVRGSRRLVLTKMQSARERQNLARYFAPNMVDSLAERDEPLGPVRSQNVAVLFADLVGFTRWAEARTPGEVIGLLREVHQRLGQVVFENDGTLDKFMGDGLMATFGTPDAGRQDAVNAIAAALAMQDSIKAWGNIHTDSPPVQLAIGVHFGPVVLGDIGSAQRMEFAVLGDTVNVASRLERATRAAACGVLISAQTAAAARLQNPRKAEALLSASTYHDGIEVPGHTAVPAYAIG